MKRLKDKHPGHGYTIAVCIPIGITNTEKMIILNQLKHLHAMNPDNPQILHPTVIRSSCNIIQSSLYS
ncbi:MAG: hypothetical protein ACTSWJ_02290 [Candidatus Heimdallarchaeaceae archaeon]